MKKKMLFGALCAVGLVLFCACAPKGIRQNVKEIEAGSVVSEMDLVTLDEGFSAEVQSGGVDSTKVGRYDVVYRLTDLKENTYKDVTFTFGVVDTTPPELTVAKGIEIGVGSVFDVMDFLTISDNADETFSEEQIVVEGSVDTSKEGIYALTVTVSDSSNNTASTTMSVSVSADNLVNFSEVESLFSSVDVLRAKFGSFTKKTQKQDGYVITQYTFPDYDVEYHTYSPQSGNGGMSVELSFSRKNTSIFGIMLGQSSYASAKTILENTGCQHLSEESTYTETFGTYTLTSRGSFALSYASLRYSVDLLCDEQDVVRKIVLSYAF